MNLSPNFPSSLNILNLTRGKEKCKILVKFQKALQMLQIQIKWRRGGDYLDDCKIVLAGLPLCSLFHTATRNTFLSTHQPCHRLTENGSSLPTKSNPNSSELRQCSPQSGLSLPCQPPLPPSPIAPPGPPALGPNAPPPSPAWSPQSGMTVPFTSTSRKPTLLSTLSLNSCPSIN